MDPIPLPDDGMSGSGESASDSKDVVTDRERRTLQALYQRARDHADDEMGPKLERSWRYFDGNVDAEPAFYVGNDENGRKVFHGSRTVIRETRDKLRAAMPEFARVFLSSEEMVAFTPKQQQDEPYAEQATDYCNYIARSQGGEERVLDAFLDWGVKFAAIKVYWDVETRQEWKGFNLMEETALQMLQWSAQQPETDLQEVESEQYEAMIELQQPDGSIVYQPEMRYRGKTRTTHKKRGIKWDLIPQEEFILDPDAMSEESALCIGQDCYRTVSDVVAMGIPWEMVKEHAGSQRPQDNDSVSVARRGRSNRLTATDVPDDSLSYVRFVECIVRLDRDEDGIAERYRAIMLGDGPEPIKLEPADDCYYLVGSPYRRPHEPIGSGIVEEGCDLQDQMTALVRGWINNMNRANNPREVVSDQDTSAYSDLKSPLSGPIRSNNPAGVAIHLIPFTANQNAPLLQYFEGRSAQRFGISPQSQGLDPDVLKSQTADGAKAIVGASQAPLEFLCREFAAGILRPMFKAILAISKRYQDKATTVRLRGEWVDVDPTEWPADMDVDIRVGLGSGTKVERMTGLMAIMQKQDQLAAEGSPLVSVKERGNSLKAFAELMGYKNAARFFKEMSDEEMAAAMQQAQQSQKQQQMEAAQMVAQAEAMKAAASAAEKAKGDIEVARINSEMQRKVQQEEAIMKMALERDKIASDERVQMFRAQEEFRLRMIELEKEERLERLKISNRSPGGNADLRQQVQ